MAKQNKDISQIKKYLDGKLDARAMYELERRAQDDPFLLDALEGYENAGRVQDKNLQDIAQRLNDRVKKKEGRIIAWRYIAAAASVLLVLSIGLFWLMKQRPITRTQIATVSILPIKKHVDTSRLIPGKKPMLADLNRKNTGKTYSAPKMAAIEKPDKKSKQDPSADITIDEPVGNAVAKVAYNAQPQANNKSTEYKKDTTPLNELVVIGYGTQKRNDANGYVATTTPLRTQNNGQLQFKSTDKVTGLEGKVAGLNLNAAKTKAITGIVKDETGPIPGATVKIKGTDIVTQTNANGNFILYAVADKAILDIASIGYEMREVRVNKLDTMVIAMVPASQQLGEVVVTGTMGINQDQDYRSARPNGGWKEFKKYLSDNAESPDGKSGTVKLSFIVNSDNSLSEFKIISSISAQTDSAAVDLVQDGPGWIKNSNGKPEKVKVRVKFEAKK